jgi:hypothetical protein
MRVIFFVLMAGLSLSSFAESWPEWECDFSASRNAESLCTLQGVRSWSRRVHFGLHYGSLAADRVVLEVLRGDERLTPQGLREFAREVEVSIASDRGPGFSVTLTPRVRRDRIEYPMQRDLSSFYISDLRVGAIKRSALLRRLVTEHFGERAILIVWAKAARSSRASARSSRASARSRKVSVRSRGDPLASDATIEWQSSPRGPRTRPIDRCEEQILRVRPASPTSVLGLT